MSNPFKVVDQFEEALCDYTGAKYCVATTSCTSALLLSMLWKMQKYDETTSIEIPKRTYIGVAMSIINAGYNIKFNDDSWWGSYLLGPSTIRDSARLLTSGMYVSGEYTCLSFHWSKHLAIGQGGAILHDDLEADKFFRRARFDGRDTMTPPKHDMTDVVGHHCYMMPRDAAEGLTRLFYLPHQNDPLPNSDYPDLSQVPAIKWYITK